MLEYRSIAVYRSVKHCSCFLICFMTIKHTMFHSLIEHRFLTNQSMHRVLSILQVIIKIVSEFWPTQLSSHVLAQKRSHKRSGLIFYSVYRPNAKMAAFILFFVSLANLVFETNIVKNLLCRTRLVRLF